MPAKASFFTSTSKKPNTSQQNITGNRSSRFSLTKKTSLKQLYTPSSTSNLMNISALKGHHRGKGSNSREEESSLGRSGYDITSNEFSFNSHLIPHRITIYRKEKLGVCEATRFDK